MELAVLRSKLYLCIAFASATSFDVQVCVLRCTAMLCKDCQHWCGSGGVSWSQE